MKNLSIIIVNWNTKDFLENCLRSIYKSAKDLKIEIFVVDNNSSDDSPQMVKEKFLDINLIENKENLGFAKANNQAIKLANGKYILLLNSDTVVLDDALSKMVKFMDKHPEAGACGPKILNPDESLQRSAWNSFPSPSAAFMERFYLYKIIPGNKLVRKFELTAKKHGAPLEVAHLLGACLLIRHETLHKVGFLDERFALFLEETDLCLRIKKYGQKIYYLPNTQIIHLGQKSVNQDRKASEIRYFQSYCKFYKKHNSSAIKLLILKFILLCGLLARAANYRFIKKENQSAGQLMEAFKTLIKNPGIQE